MPICYTGDNTSIMQIYDCTVVAYFMVFQKQIGKIGTPFLTVLSLSGHNEFGLRWLLRRFNICPNAYYNYRKHRKADYYARREKVLSKITDIYHKHHGVTVYRSMQVYLEREGFSYSTATVHKYMNSILGLKSIVRTKKPEYEYGEPHKVFENKIQQIKSIKNGVPILPICF